MALPREKGVSGCVWWLGEQGGKRWEVVDRRNGGGSVLGNCPLKYEKNIFKCWVWG